MKLFKVLIKVSVGTILLAAAGVAPAAQLSTDARTAIPHEVQQLVVVDYRAMQNSTSAMNLRDRVMPPELKQFDDALRKSGLNDNHDVDELAFALFRPTESSDTLVTVGIAQGQFATQDILANFRKQKIMPTLVRANRIYPLAKTGMVLCFVDPSTMVFGGKDAVDKALDARDGVSPSLLTNGPMMDAMKSVDSEPLWSILDEKGTQTMMRQVLGEAGCCHRLRERCKAAAGLLVLDGLSARRQVRPDHLHRRLVCRGHHLFAFDGGCDAEEDERLGRGKAGVERDRHRLGLRAAFDPLCHFRRGFQQPAAVAALQEHGALEQVLSDGEMGRLTISLNGSLGGPLRLDR